MSKQAVCWGVVCVLSPAGPRVALKATVSSPVWWFSRPHAQEDTDLRPFWSRRSFVPLRDPFSASSSSAVQYVLRVNCKEAGLPLAYKRLSDGIHRYLRKTLPGWPVMLHWGQSFCCLALWSDVMRKLQSATSSS